mmetsp:Transcript_80253/g.162547  ORF Transcript_80253/g.162547 Transcript_80253/m.162547 type:complete len:110 (+) Transcript_80253:256-585(+)
MRCVVAILPGLLGLPCELLLGEFDLSRRGETTLFFRTDPGGEVEPSARDDRGMLSGTPVTGFATVMQQAGHGACNPICTDWPRRTTGAAKAKVWAEAPPAGAGALCANA